MRLIYTTDQMPGYKRIRKGKGFSFILPDGGLLSDKDKRRRILSLAIPPAYENVWISIESCIPLPRAWGRAMPRDFGPTSEGCSNF